MNLLTKNIGAKVAIDARKGSNCSRKENFVVYYLLFLFEMSSQIYEPPSTKKVCLACSKSITN